MRLLVILLLFVLPSVSAQTKFEREFGIPEKEVPSPALEKISLITGKRRLRWYREESSDGSSIEAKFRWNRSHFSVEFDTLGMLQDVEVEISLKKLPHNQKLLVYATLASEFRQPAIKRVQLQFPAELFDAAFRDTYSNLPENLPYAFEITLFGRKDEESISHAYEVKLDAHGEVLTIEQIIQPNAAHLLY